MASFGDRILTSDKLVEHENLPLHIAVIGRGAIGVNRGLLRVWAARDDGRLLATQIAAPAAEHMAHLLVLAIGQGMTVNDVLRMPFYHPKRVRRLMLMMGLMPIYRCPNTSKSAKGQGPFPSLLRGLAIERPNQVWCADIPHLPMRKGFLNLVATMDWRSRRVLA